jgi:hypothetical protein
MPPDRREFIRLVSGATAGSIFLAGCDDVAVQTPISTDLSSDAPAASSSPSSVTPSTTPNATSAVSTTMASLQTYLQKNASPTFDIPAVATSIPSISWAGKLTTSSVATSLPNGVVFPVTSPLINGPLRNEYAASLPGAPSIGGYPCSVVTRLYSCKGQPREVGSPTVLRFMTDAPVLELAGVGADGSPDGAVTTLIVNGQLVPPVALACSLGIGGWINGSIRVDFGSRSIRDIWVQTDLSVAYIKIDNDDTLFPVDDQAEPQITVIGDSYLQRPSTNFANIALELGARLGIRQVAVDCIGGTGYWNSGGNVGNLNDRLPADVVDNSTIYLMMAGLNDYGDYTNPPPQLVWPTRATYEEAVIGYMQSLRNKLPDALIVVTAPFCPVPPMSDSSYVSNPATNTSGLGDFLYKAQVHKNAVQQVAGPWVYIDVLMGGGWLNSSGATGDVTNLQWFTGGTPGPGTTATNKPGNTNGGGGGGFGGISSIPVISAGIYTQAPNVTASGGSGSGLLLSATMDATGALTSINVAWPGVGYTNGAGLPTITVDTTYQVVAATIGAPVLMVGVNPDGGYPLPAFAPAGVPGDLNNIYVMLMPDLTHPSPEGVAYLSTRLAQNIYDAVMAL